MKFQVHYKKEFSYRLFGFTILLLMVVVQVSAYAYPVAPVIERGATIFIGEEGLDLTHALNRAGGLDGAAVDREVPTNWTIGWWAPAAYTEGNDPAKILNVSSRYQNFTVTPADFIGYTGNWYLVNPETRTAIIGSDGHPRVVFIVKEPRLEIRIWDFDTNSDVTGKSIPRGDSLGFRIDTNMNDALNSLYRSPVNGDTVKDGYIDIIVQNGTNFPFTSLSDIQGTPHTILRQNVSSSSWTWGDPGNPTSPHPWATGADDGNGRPLYPAGTYTVTAESLLNNMKANYRQSGADYFGRTVSLPNTRITLVDKKMGIEANRDSVSRGDHFSVTIIGRPLTAHYLWVYNTGTMTGAPGDQPPTILASAPVFQDPYEGPYAIGAHAISGAGGKMIAEDVPPSTDTVSRNEYYAKVVTSPTGTATVEFRTSPDTKPGKYIIRAECASLYNDAGIVVGPNIQPVAADAIKSDYVIFHPAINPDIRVPANNDLKRISRGGTIFIGEDGLDVSGPLASAAELAVPALSTQGTQIAWWASAAEIMKTSPSKTLDMAGRETSFFVSAADFVGYTGTWYLVDSTTGMAARNREGSPIPVFIVANPSIDFRIIDLDTSTDVTGRSAPLGDRLTFRISTNMYEAFNSRSRPDISGNTPGYISLVMKNEMNAKLNYLYQDTSTAHSLESLPVNSRPWFWSGGGQQYYWNTSLLDRDYYSLYPAGTYTIRVESLLNAMKDNYKQGGADYTGKTLSEYLTVTLVPASVRINPNHDSVPQGDRFSVTITGRPESTYYVWVNNTGTMTGASGDQPPTILVSAPVYQDPYEGPFAIGTHSILGSGGKKITEDVPPSTGNVSRNEYYAKIVTSSSGTATVEFQTSPHTKPGTYSIRVENDAFSDGTQVTVLSETLPRSTGAGTDGRVIYHPNINPDTPVLVNNDLKRISRGGILYIGEEGLDISEPLASANALAVPSMTPRGTRIGWWSWRADIKLTSPSKTIDLAGRETSFTVFPEDFVGYFGSWYLTDPLTGGAALDSGGNPIPVFYIENPLLEIKIWDLDTRCDVSGKSVPQGERLTFRIDTNMYHAFDTGYRRDISGNTPGTINIIVKNEGNARYNYLYQNTTTAYSLLNQRVENITPYFWGGNVTPQHFWATDLLDRDQDSFYPAGTYTVCAESTLNNMRTNYRQGGADYTGKTVSQCNTITIVTEKAMIETNNKTSAAGNNFPFTFPYTFPVTFPGRENDRVLTMPRVDNSSAVDLYKKGNSLVHLGRYQDALDVYNEVLSIDPFFVNASRNRGYTLIYLGRYQDAVEAYDKALSVDPDFVDAWTGRGNALANFDRYQESLDAYDRALSIDPGSLDAWDGKAYPLIKLSRFHEALDAENIALSINPNDTHAWANKGYALFRLGRYQEGLNASDQALAIDPENEIAWTNKGAALINLYRYDEALAATNKALEINPNSTVARENKLVIGNKTGKKP